MGWVRDGVLHVRVSEPGASVLVRWEPSWGIEAAWDFVYVQAPDGSLIERVDIEPGNARGEQDVPLDRGPGDYRVEVTGTSHRRFHVIFSGEERFLFEPVQVHQCFQSHNGAPLERWFDVPAGISSFTLGGRYHDGGPHLYWLYGPDGTLVDSRHGGR